MVRSVELVVQETRDCTTEELLANLQAEIECESPSTDLLSYKGDLSGFPLIIGSSNAWKPPILMP